MKSTRVFKRNTELQVCGTSRWKLLKMCYSNTIELLKTKNLEYKLTFQVSNQALHDLMCSPSTVIESVSYSHMF